MTDFFSLQFNPSRSFRIGGIVVATILGWFTYYFLNFIYEVVGFRYETEQYALVNFYEWILAARLIFFGSVPAIFLVLKLIFLRASWKKLGIIAAIVGFLLTIPSFRYNMKRWEIVLYIVDDLPISQKIFSRWNNGFLGSYGMSLDFMISDESYAKVERVVTERLFQSNESLARYPLLLSKSEARFYADKQTPDGREISRHWRDEFIRSMGVIKATIDIR